MSVDDRLVSVAVLPCPGTKGPLEVLRSQGVDAVLGPPFTMPSGYGQYMPDVQGVWYDLLVSPQDADRAEELLGLAFGFPPLEQWRPPPGPRILPVTRRRRRTLSWTLALMVSVVLAGLLVIAR